ncbi:MAG: hypothetical protein APR53_10810 [Methanoculleus sp. SDB]|nr:MAG: hypothetical protein APR53_10810 [Methanoculleus sp. SDB]
MNETAALKCYECAVKADGQMDLILSILGKLHTIRSNGDLGEREIGNAREVALIALSEALKETKMALNSTKEGRFENIAEGLGRAIRLVERDRYYEAGDVVAELASDRAAISHQAIQKMFNRTQSLW